MSVTAPVEIEEPIEQLDEEVGDIVPTRYSITSYGADYPVDGLIRRLTSGDIYVPPFQRGYVWSLKQGSRFIESLLLGLPVPGIFLAREQDTQRLIVIDGQQRLRTLEFFYVGVFGPTRREFSLDLSTAETSNALHGLTYKALSPDDRRRLDDSIIHATIIRQDEPSDGQSSIYSIFERLNTGGVLLDPQEIRASIFYGEMSSLLAELNLNRAWRSVFGPQSKRMRDQELILRFFALYHDIGRYNRPMKEFLNSYMGRNRNIESDGRAVLTELFVGTIEGISDHIGSKAFRPKVALNAAVFDAVMIGVARRMQDRPILNPASLREKHALLLAREGFQTATTRSTADRDRVLSRIELATSVFAEVQ